MHIVFGAYPVFIVLVPCCVNCIRNLAVLIAFELCCVYFTRTLLCLLYAYLVVYSEPAAYPAVIVLVARFVFLFSYLAVLIVFVPCCVFFLFSYLALFILLIFRCDYCILSLPCAYCTHTLLC